MEYRKCSTFNLPEPPEGMRIVAMTEFKEQLIVATEKGVYRKEGEKFVRLEFVEKAEQPLQGGDSE